MTNDSYKRKPPMDHNDLFISEMEEVLHNINTQMEVIAKEAREKDVHPYEMKNKDGTYALADLLTAKGNLISALSLLVVARDERLDRPAPPRFCGGGQHGRRVHPDCPRKTVHSGHTL